MPESRRLDIEGIINLNKPPGKTSFQMVALVRKLSRERKVGHAGTLDPDATGVLPILVGQATKLAQFLTEGTKVYRAEIRLGSSTTTYDAGGEITQVGDPSSLSTEQVKLALGSFCGITEQTPPMYSAIKQNGKPLYLLARSGIEVPRKSREITISRLDVLDWQNPLLVIEVECSKGTYIRSLAHDLGQRLGCGAHLSKLARLKCGPFDIENAVNVEQLEDVSRNDRWKTIVRPMDTALAHLESLIVDAAGEADISHGRAFTMGPEQERASGRLCRAYSSDGRFLALVRFDPERNLWQPESVFMKQEHLSGESSVDWRKLTGNCC